MQESRRNQNRIKKLIIKGVAIPEKDRCADLR